MNPGVSTRAARLRRRFTILDATILVASMAPGLAMLRTWDLEDWSLIGIGLMDILELAFYLRPFIYPFLMGLTVAALVLGLIRPRPEIRRVFRQSGMAACAVATLAMAVDILPVLACRAIDERSEVYFVRTTYAWSVAPAIEGVWAVLALGGRWRRGRSWVEVLGVCLGIAWIALQGVEFTFSVAITFASR